MFAIKIDLRDEDEEEFNTLKKTLGLKADTEVVRFALNRCYQDFVLRNPIPIIPLRGVGAN